MGRQFREIVRQKVVKAVKAVSPRGGSGALQIERLPRGRRERGFTDFTALSRPITKTESIRRQ